MAKRKVKKMREMGISEKQEANKPAHDRGEELMVWRAHPFVTDTRKAVIFSISSLAMAAFVATILRENTVWWFLFSMAVILGAFNNYVFPSNFKMTTKGIELKNGMNLIFKPWNSFPNYTHYDDGIMLWYKQRGLRERLFKGIMLYYGNGDKEQIDEAVERYMKRD